MRVLPSDKTSAEQIKLIRKYLKLKIMEDNVSFINHKQERDHVYDLMKRTILHGESHSALMLGPRGSGKTTLINSVLNQLSKEVDISSDAIIVKLNGMLHHDDKVALKSITAQMQLENAVGDRVFGTFAENLSFLLSCLQCGADRKCKSMVFLLEEFDMFCHSGRTQSLLYNLFDITHSKQAPMCVLGITNRLDVMELLEKRVKSRFSHRHIFLFPNEDSGELRSPIDNFKQVLLRLLSMPCKKAPESPKRKKGRAGRRSVHIEEPTDVDTDDEYSIPEVVLYKCKTNREEFRNLDPGFVEDWNSHVNSLIEDDTITDAIEKFCYYTGNEQVFRNVLFQLICQLSPTKPYIDATEFSNTIDKTVAPEHRVKLLQSLSILELSLVIAMKHGMEIFDGQPMNFEMVLHRYTKFANTNSSTQTVPRPVILKAFEHLQALEIILPVRNTDSIYNTDNTTSRVQKEYKLFTLAVPVDDISEAVKSFKALPTEISHWYSNSVF
ncbi:origin recognition complex subunit 4 [Amyelois transitella]|uniref:origin recognition complex subunit 4 n=1 Tax=Amyelois transitella TaxID=680683 RepID=UPI00067DCD1E|nr:origin recognition complex subunit 4 [Amyelois transitella]XP_060808635.1 origin recognition complex subunit 4 [Amyelois transitella]